ncbi:MAG: peptide ABC transporter substrate-binding protein [Chloroflexi bacterium]|nr:peptide ABC transporter substrate-binding protein [Chloroflexota bacterium]
MKAKRYLIIILLASLVISCDFVTGLVAGDEPDQNEETEPASETQEVEIQETEEPTVEPEVVVVVETVVVVTEPPPPPPPPTPVDFGPVIYQGTSTIPFSTLDPQIREDLDSLDFIENLFVNLTNIDLATSEIVPEAAINWTISQDGLTYTFYIRSDIPWVKYNPVTGETTQEFDDESNPRFVTAYDFEYGIKRACDPNMATYPRTVIAPQILGCEEVLYYDDPENVPVGMWDAIGVTAVDAETLEIELAFPAAYFISMTSMSSLAATPQWAIETNGNDWTDPGTIVTSGPYVLAEWLPDEVGILNRNPLMPEDMQGEGNIEIIIIRVVPDVSTSYAMWLAGEIDLSGIPGDELWFQLDQFPEETQQTSNLAVYSIFFNYGKPPFNDQNVRAAFSAALDRVEIAQGFEQRQGLPMIHFTPPVIFGAPPIDEVGVGYEPEWASAQLAAAGYPDCQGFPQVNFHLFSAAYASIFSDFALQAWTEILGCDPDLFQIETDASFSAFLEAISLDSAAERPNMWMHGWAGDYNDPNTYLGDMLWCENGLQWLTRPCNSIDDFIVAAHEELDPAARAELYQLIEQSFFGLDGEFPSAPVWMTITSQAQQTWLTMTPANGVFGGEQWYNWTIDQEVQFAGVE